MDQEETLARKFAEPFSRIDAALVPVNEGQIRMAQDARQDLEGMMKDPIFTSAVIARAVTIATQGVSSTFLTYRIAAVNAYLQRKLTEEHVAAQEKTSAAAESLQVAAKKVAVSSYWMAVAGFIVTVAALYVSVVKG